MKAAVSAVLNSEMGYKKAASKFAFPQTTLERYVKKERYNPGSSISMKIGRFKCVFNEDQEKELVHCLVTMEQRLFSLPSPSITCQITIASVSSILLVLCHEAT
jgi:hypothetical protein